MSASVLHWRRHFCVQLLGELLHDRANEKITTRPSSSSLHREASDAYVLLQLRAMLLLDRLLYPFSFCCRCGYGGVRRPVC